MESNTLISGNCEHAHLLAPLITELSVAVNAVKNVVSSGMQQRLRNTDKAPAEEKNSF